MNIIFKDDILYIRIRKGRNEMISVIVPVYNVEPYLKACVDSLLNQSYSDFEVLLINDGSTDNSGEICRELSKASEKIQYFSQDNQGLSAARNRGLLECSGEYVCFVDSDDIVHPRYLEILYQNMMESHALISICSYLVFEQDTELDMKKEISNKIVIRDKTDLMSSLAYTGCREKNTTIIIACNKLFSRELFSTCCFSPGKLHEDELMIHHLVDKIPYAVFTTSQLYFYRKRSGSITDKKFLQDIRHLSMIEAFRERVFICQKREYEEIRTKMTESYLDTICIQLFRMLEADKTKVWKRLKKLLDTESVKLQQSIHKRKKLIYRVIVKHPVIASRVFQCNQFFLIKKKNLIRKICKCMR